MLFYRVLDLENRAETSHRLPGGPLCSIVFLAGSRIQARIEGKQEQMNPQYRMNQLTFPCMAGTYISLIKDRISNDKESKSDNLVSFSWLFRTHVLVEFRIIHVQYLSSIIPLLTFALLGGEGIETPRRFSRLSKYGHTLSYIFSTHIVKKKIRPRSRKVRSPGHANRHHLIKV